MRFPGYWVTLAPEKAILQRTSFDETELDPAANWQEAWQNQDVNAAVKGFVGIKPALFFAASHLAKLENRSVDQSIEVQIEHCASNWGQEMYELSGLDDFFAKMSD